MIAKTYEGASLVRLLYTSQSAMDAHAPDYRSRLTELVRTAGEANQRRRVTGAIAVVRGTFVQVLEGELAVVEDVFEAICRDRRHREIRLAELAPCDSRLFTGWSMALLGASMDVSEVDFVQAHALEDVYQSLSVSPSFALKKMRAMLDTPSQKAA